MRLVVIDDQNVVYPVRHIGRVEELDLGDESVQIRVLAAVMVAIKHALTGTAESLTVDDVAEQATPPAILDHNRVDLPR